MTELAEGLGLDLAGELGEGALERGDPRVERLQVDQRTKLSVHLVPSP